MMQLDIYDEAFRANPYAYFKKFRTFAPVCRIKPHGHWAIFNYADVQYILKNDNIFSSVISEQNLNLNQPDYLLSARSLVGMDGLAHKVLRKQVASSFKPSLIKQLERSIRHDCQTLIAAIKSNTPIDFIEVFSAILPVMTIIRLLGLDLAKISLFRQWVTLLLTWRNHPDQALVLENVHEMYDYFNTVIEKKRRFPTEDLISILIFDFNLEQNSILSLIRLMLVAATDTTTALLNHCILALAEFPEQFILFLNGKRTTLEIVNETLRFNSPTISLMRKAVENVVLSTIQINKGEIVLPIVASANHDEMQFKNAHNFDLGRKQNTHLALGTGIHYCLGTHLAKLQACIALETLFDRFSTIELIKAEPLSYLPSFFFRSLYNLPVVFS